MPQLDKKIIKERAKILREAGSNQLQKYLEKQIGKEFEVLLEKNNLGKTRNFLDVEIISDEKNKLQKGNIYSFKINKTKNNLLIVDL
jgi:tRNA A37 methylthiotransferase MiaB